MVHTSSTLCRTLTHFLVQESLHRLNGFIYQPSQAELGNEKKVWYIYLLYCFLPSVHSLQIFCLFFFFVLCLHLKLEASASDLSTEKPKPTLSRLTVVALLRSWLRGEEGHFQNTKHSQLPPSSRSPGSRRNSLVFCDTQWICKILGFAYFSVFFFHLPME